MKKLAVLVLTVLTAALSLCGCGSRTDAPDTATTTRSVPTFAYVRADFQNIMGYDGYWEEELYNSQHHTRRYYAEENGKVFPIAVSWYWKFDPSEKVEDYVLDIDGDGVTELVCNTLTGADIHAEVYIFRRTANGVECGRIDREKANIPDFDDWGANASVSCYDAQTGQFLLSYDVKDSKEDKEIAVSLDAFAFTPLEDLSIL